MTSSPPRASDLPAKDQIRLLSGYDVWHTESVPGAPGVRLADGPHGLRVQPGDSDHLGLAASQPATCFPPAVTLASSWDADLVSEVGAAIAVEARGLGVGVVLGPGLNIKRHPLCGRNFEYFSEDPLVSGVLAAAMVEGIQATGEVGACPKHFAVNNQEYHRFVSDVIVDERTLRELYLTGFERVIKQAHPWAVMTAYNLVNGQPCSAHGHLLGEILRHEWEYDGLVMSDWGATTQRPAGVAAGMDLEMPASSGLYDDQLAAAVADGTLATEAVAACAQRVIDLSAKVKARPSGTPSGAPEVPHAAHDALARKAAAAGTVLLQNDGLLPLPPDLSIGLIGAFAQSPRYQGTGSSQVNPFKVTTAHEAFADHPGGVHFAAGYNSAQAIPDASLIAEAVAVAEQVDVCVVLVGLPGTYESEGFDRELLDLPQQHNDLVHAVAAANPRTVVALSNGSPVLMPWRSKVAAILESYLGGQASGGALYDVITGAAEPGGRLAETFPASLEQVAANPWFPGAPHQVQYREGLFVGYRHHTTADLEPLFAFGHGLSYATFEWGPLSLSSTTITPGDPVRAGVQVTNTSTRPGSEVVQVYLHDQTGVVLRPRRILAGWAKLHLAPGESKQCEVELDPRAFAFYDVRADTWATPSGKFTIEAARSSIDIASTAELEITGGVETSTEPPSVNAIAASDADFGRRLGREIPQARHTRPFTVDSTLGEIRRTFVGGLLVKAVESQNPVDVEADDAASQLMLERSLRELPLRAVAIFSQGKIKLPALNLIVKLLNGNYSGIAKWMMARGKPDLSI